MTLLQYVLKRILYSVITLFVLITVTFFMMRLLPGDPFLGEKAVSPEIMDVLKAKYGLDKPLFVQYVKYLGNTIKFDFGDSMNYRNRSVNDVIKQAFPYSFDLGMRALIFAIIAGIFLGVVAGINHGKAWDTASVVIAVIGVSVPSFIMGSIIQYFITLKFQAFLQPLIGQRFIPIGGWTSGWSKLLPPFALGLGSLATIARLMRASMLDVVGQDYIKTARSKGLSERTIVWRHAIRNAILPVITILGPLAATLLTGTFIVENIFNIPGLGKHFIMGVQASDYTMISGLTLFYGFFLIIANMLVDIAYGFVDPRIRISKGKG